MALVQRGKRLPGPLCTIAKHLGAPPIIQILPEIHPGIEVIQDQLGLGFEPRHGPRDPQLPRTQGLVEFRGSFEIGFRCSRARMQSASEAPPRRRPLTLPAKFDDISDDTIIRGYCLASLVAALPEHRVT